MPRLLSSLVLLALATACGGDKPAASAGGPEAAAPAVPPAATGAAIEVKAISDGAKNYFEPSTITAKRGDRIKLVLVNGVHNLAFPAAKNPAGAALPEATEMLQLPGQAAEVPITMAAGRYTFICVPHEALGMIGTLDVTE